MSNLRNTVEVVLKGRNDLGPALDSARHGVREMADGSIGQVERIGRGFLALQGIIAGSAVALAAKAVFAPAIEDEEFVAKLQNVLGSLAAAKERFEELDALEKRSRFELPGLVEASTALQQFGANAMASGAGFRSIVDAASGTNNSVDAVAQAIGQLWDSLQAKTGSEGGLRQLKIMRVLSADGAEAIKAMADAQMDAAQIWTIVTAELAKYNGASARMLGTTQGQLGLLKKDWEDARKTIGAVALPALTAAVADLLGQLEAIQKSGELAKWGTELREALTAVWEMLTGLCAYIKENKEALELLGFTYAGVTLVNALHGQMAILAGFVEAAGGKAAVAAVSTRTLATSMAELRMATVGLGAIAFAAFEGYELGKAIANVTGLTKAIVGLYETEAQAAQTPELQMQQEMWADKYGAGGRNDAGQSFYMWRRAQAAPKAAAAPTGPTAEQQKAQTAKELSEYEKRVRAEAEAKKAATDKATADGKTAAESAAAEGERAAKAAAEARRDLAELEAKAIQDAADRKIDAEISAQQREVDVIRRTADDKAKALQAAQDKVSAITARLAMTPDQRREEERAAKDQQRAAGRDQRRTAAAWERAQEGLPISARGRLLIEKAMAEQKAAGAKRGLRNAEGRAGFAEIDLAGLEANKDQVAAQREAAAQARKRASLQAIIRAGGAGAAAAGAAQANQRRASAAGREAVRPGAGAAGGAGDPIGAIIRIDANVKTMAAKVDKMAGLTAKG